MFLQLEVEPTYKESVEFCRDLVSDLRVLLTEEGGISLESADLGKLEKVKDKIKTFTDRYKKEVELTKNGEMTPERTKQINFYTNMAKKMALLALASVFAIPILGAAGGPVLVFIGLANTLTGLILSVISVVKVVILKKEFKDMAKKAKDGDTSAIKESFKKRLEKERKNDLSFVMDLRAKAVKMRGKAGGNKDILKKATELSEKAIKSEETINKKYDALIASL